MNKNPLDKKDLEKIIKLKISRDIKSLQKRLFKKQNLSEENITSKYQLKDNYLNKSKYSMI